MTLILPLVTTAVLHAIAIDVYIQPQLDCDSAPANRAAFLTANSRQPRSSRQCRCGLIARWPFAHPFFPAPSAASEQGSHSATPSAVLRYASQRWDQVEYIHFSPVPGLSSNQ
ncbi:hypothetical protein DFH07DRAFT_967796 [Mycena maculata]|uniref:Secreted protein n=1 Tax=Mycena maculata TaxID=230809 RepID=A0AAD7MUW9_9AGAR|nr:hypothetical protein DFH07DRAFT_967796 [Mycena maculata]